MIKKIKQLATTLALGLILLAPLAVPATVNAAESSADVDTALKCGSNFDAQPLDSCDADVAAESGNSINDLIALVVNIFSIVVGVVAVIMIIVGGFKYITSGGESSNVSGAKNTILYAIIGLIIVAMAQAIVHFVLDKVA